MVGTRRDVSISRSLISPFELHLHPPSPLEWSLSDPSTDLFTCVSGRMVASVLLPRLTSVFIYIFYIYNHQWHYSCRSEHAPRDMCMCKIFFMLLAHRNPASSQGLTVRARPAYPTRPITDSNTATVRITSYVQ